MFLAECTGGCVQRVALDHFGLIAWTTVICVLISASEHVGQVELLVVNILGASTVKIVIA